MRMVSARELVGRRIIAFEPLPFKSGESHDNRLAHRPIVYLDDGSCLTFTTEEVEGDYGTFIGRHPHCAPPSGTGTRPRNP